MSIEEQKEFLAPSDQEINDTLCVLVESMCLGPERNSLTINSVRSKAEKLLGLEEGFLKTGPWKKRSRDLVKTESVRKFFVLSLTQVPQEPR